MKSKMMTASATVNVKSDAQGNPTGIVEAIVSVFDNVDLVGDRVVKGAFAGFVQRVKDGWKAPFVWSHNTRTPDMFIGDTIDAEETDEGLKIRAQLHMDEPVAAKVHSLIEKQQVSQYSFAYKVLEGRWVEEDGKDIYELVKLDVSETGPTMYGANPATRTLAVKDAAGEPARESSEELDGSTHESDEESEKANEAPENTPLTGEEIKQLYELASATYIEL